MDWVARIQRRWSYVHVTTCTGSDMAANCKGWTADEVRLLYGALANNPYDTSKTSITFNRQADPIDPTTNGPIPDSGIAAETSCPPGKGSCNLTFYDFAWYGGPSAGFMDTQIYYYSKSEGAFLGSLVHELTHVAIYQNPQILDNWTRKNNHPNPNWGIGGFYSWGYLEYRYANDPTRLDRAKQEEMMAMSTAVNVTGWYDHQTRTRSPYQPPWYK